MPAAPWSRSFVELARCACPIGRSLSTGRKGCNIDEVLADLDSFDGDWDQVLSELAPESSIRPLIEASWRRCIASGLDPNGSPLHRIPSADLERRLESSAELLHVARPHLDWISATLTDMRHVLYLADPDGIVLHSTGNDTELRDLAGLSPGYDWSESRMGTNGAGTALVSGEPTAVIGPEHYARPFHDCTCTAAPIRGPDGSIIGAIDLTTFNEPGVPGRLVLIAYAARTIEQELIALRETAEREEAESARAAAEEANEVKSAFMATISHELRTPLNAILGYADLLEMGIPEPLGEAAARQVNRIRLAAKHQQQLIEEILTFSRIEAGREQLNIEMMVVREVLEEVSAIVQPLVLEKDLDFAVEARRAPHAIETDPRKLRQILLNLLGNAVKFTDRGAIRLEVERVTDEVVFHVRDTGVGIAPEEQERLFEPFWQADQSTTREAGGTGLGLAIAQRLTRMMGGRIVAESVVGDGSTFTVRLPLGSGSEA